MQQLPQIAQRADGIASTNVTNELARAVAGLAPIMQSGPDDPASPWALHPSLGVIVNAGPASEADYTDERYWVKEVFVNAGDSESAEAQVTFADRTETSLIGESEPIIHTVSNLAEKAAGSHLLPVDGTRYVIFWPEEDIRASVSGLTRWIMDVGGNAAATPVVVKITANAAGGGKYDGGKCTGESTAAPTGDLALPEGMTDPAGTDCLIINRAEDGQATHVLTAGSYWPGEIIGQTSESTPRDIVLIDGASPTKGTAQYQVYQMLDGATAGWDWVRAH